VREDVAEVGMSYCEWLLVARSGVNRRVVKRRHGLEDKYRLEVGNRGYVPFPAAVEQN